MAKVDPGSIILILVIILIFLILANCMITKCSNTLADKLKETTPTTIFISESLS